VSVGYWDSLGPDNLQLQCFGLVQRKLWGHCELQLVQDEFGYRLLLVAEAVGVKSETPFSALQTLTYYSLQQPPKFHNREISRLGDATSISIQAPEEVLVDLKRMCVQGLQQPSESGWDENGVEPQRLYVNERVLANVLIASVEQYYNVESSHDVCAQEVNKESQGSAEQN